MSLYPKVHCVPSGSSVPLCGRAFVRAADPAGFNALGEDQRCRRCDTILNGPKPRPLLSREEAARLRALIAAELEAGFRFARSMSEIPHFYVRRTAANTAAFYELVRAIQRCGVSEEFGGQRFRYLYPGDGWKYWLMSGTPTIINRAEV